MATLVSSVPLSLTTVDGQPRWAPIASNSRATRCPGSDVSATSARHSRVKSPARTTPGTGGRRIECRTRNRATSAGSPRPAAPSARACRWRACDRCDGAPAAAPRHIAGAASCGSDARPRALAEGQAAGSRNVVARPPTRVDGRAPLHHPHDDGGSGPSRGPPRSQSTPDARSPRDAHAGEQRPRAVRQASPFFSSHVFQHRVVQHRIRQQLLQPRVLRL